MSRHGVLVAEKEHLLDQVRELKQQRTLNARRIRAANLEVRGAANAVWKLRGVQGQHEELWSSDAVAYAEDYLRLAVHAQELKVHMKVLKAQVKAMDADMASSADCSRRRLRWAMAQGAYDDRMRVMAMELMGKANMGSMQVPSVIDIVARYYGIHIPERVKGRGYMTPASSRGLPPPHPQHVSTHPDRDGGLVAAPSGRVHHREGRSHGRFRHPLRRCHLRRHRDVGLCVGLLRRRHRRVEDQQPLAGDEIFQRQDLQDAGEGLPQSLAQHHRALRDVGHGSGGAHRRPLAVGGDERPRRP